MLQTLKMKIYVNTYTTTLTRTLPDLKFKFDIDADVEGKSNLDKAKTLFDGDIGYQCIS